MGIWLLFVFTGRSSATLAFSLPEVEFLFPGPFSRRELLAYRLLILSLGPLGTALFTLIFLRQFGLWWPAILLGVWLTFVFVQTSALAVRLALDWLAARVDRSRILLLVIGVLLLASCLWQARAAFQERMPGSERLAIVESTWVAQGLLAPFMVCSRLLQAQTAHELELYGGLSLAANALAIVLVMWMDANFLEASVAASQKRYEMIERMRRGGGGFGLFGVLAKPRLRLPQFPRLAGAGPVAWRQAMELLRTSARLIIVLPALIATGAPALLGGQQGFTASIVMVTVLLSFLISGFMPMGLRTDLEHIDALKSLPVSAGAIVSGSIASAVLYPTLIQWLIVGLLCAIMGEWPLVATLSVCFVLPLNLLLVAADSVLVLLYPSTRHVAMGDFLAGVRMMLVYTIKYLFLLVAAIAPGVYLLGIHVALGDRLFVAAAGAGWRW